MSFVNAAIDLIINCHSEMSVKSHLNVYVRIRPLSVKESMQCQDKKSSIFKSEVESKVFSMDNSRTTSVIHDNIILFGKTLTLIGRTRKANFQETNVLNQTKEGNQVRV